ncbi:hypothetical protein [Mesobacillus zeae]|uniref:Uncharacterized protein n=1 Tax=Mesobacillus zeae TaxID=1917180 RepID=A0A398BCG2_9BACI|nr:hypothetical protein [Mesobacillus zeae]RID87522.1 hypothetical protein D1970_04965 [Mesobacillus zeae]
MLEKIVVLYVKLKAFCASSPLTLNSEKNKIANDVNSITSPIIARIKALYDPSSSTPLLIK